MAWQFVMAARLRRSSRAVARTVACIVTRDKTQPPVHRRAPGDDRSAERHAHHDLRPSTRKKAPGEPGAFGIWQANLPPRAGADHEVVVGVLGDLEPEVFLAPEGAVGLVDLLPLRILGR